MTDTLDIAADLRQQTRDFLAAHDPATTDRAA